MLDGSMYSNGIFTNKISQDLRVTEEAIQGAASLEVVVSALMCFVASFITQKCVVPRLQELGRAREARGTHPHPDTCKAHPEVRGPTTTTQ